MMIASLDCFVTSASRWFSARLCSRFSAMRLKVWLIASNSGSSNLGNRVPKRPFSISDKPPRILPMGCRDRPRSQNTSALTSTKNPSTSQKKLLRSSQASRMDREASDVITTVPFGRFSRNSPIFGSAKRVNQSGAHLPCLYWDGGEV